MKKHDYRYLYELCFYNSNTGKLISFNNFLELEKFCLTLENVSDIIQSNKRR